MELFKQVKINLPLLDAINHVSTYAKYLRDLCTVKRKQCVKKNSYLADQVSSIIKHNLPHKYQDPSSKKYQDLRTPIISYVIGNQRINHALLDLGASVSLFPFSVYQQLGLG